MGELVPKIAAATVLGIIGGLFLFFGVGLLAYALATALAPALGVAGGAAVAGGVLVGPPFFWALIVLLIRRAPPKPAPLAQGSLWLALFGAIAKETPWVAILGAGAVGIAEMFLARRKK